MSALLILEIRKTERKQTLSLALLFKKKKKSSSYASYMWQYTGCNIVSTRQARDHVQLGVYSLYFLLDTVLDTMSIISDYSS